MTDVIDRFLEKASSHHANGAVVDKGRVHTYAEMTLLVRALAAAFQARRAHPRVMVILDQGYMSYAAMLAALLAGGYYTPVNLQSPITKIKSIATQFDPDVVVASAEMFDKVFDASNDHCKLIDTSMLSPQLEAGNAECAFPRHDLAYVMFTSGTTGDPKGVMVPRAALNHYVDWMMEVIQPTSNDRWSQHPNIAFDMSQFDIYGALCSGGSLFPFNTPTDRMLPAAALRRHEITIWNSVPSVISQMIQAKQLKTENLASLRLMNFCGEALLKEHLDAIFTARQDLPVQNTYGPTEATISCTLLRLDAENYSNFCMSNVSIGEPINGTQLHLVDGPNTDEGELVISGAQLARGYWKNTIQTENKFREMTVDGQKTIGYHTGDYAKRIRGNLYFAGRLDFQVKIRGVRLELHEIDAALRKCGFINAATAMIDNEIHAFLETDKVKVDHTSLRLELSALLEPHAIPVHFHPYKDLPRNANDKIDLKALIAMVGTPLVGATPMPLPKPEELVAAALRCNMESLVPGSALAVHANWDSFGHLMVMLQLEEHYDVSITDESIRRYESLAMIHVRYSELTKSSAAE